LDAKPIFDKENLQKVGFFFDGIVFIKNRLIAKLILCIKKSL
jgi:hypothetical protein